MLSRNALMIPFINVRIYIAIKIEYIFYYCKNEKEVKEELEKIILPIQFYSNELGYTFEITSGDILKEVGEYIYIKLLFSEYGGNCILGKPFSLKYKFMFNPDKIKRDRR